MSQQADLQWRVHARYLIGEMAPMGIQGAFNSYGYLFYLSFVGLGFVIYDFFKKRKPENLLLVFWFLVVFLICGILTEKVGQVRFSYYLSVIVALLSSFLITKGFYFSLAGLKNSWQDRKRKRKPKLYAYQLTGSVVVLVGIFYFIFHPYPFLHDIVAPFPQNLPVIVQQAVGTAATGAIQREQDWYDTMDWIREKTPHPGVDYYGLYDAPKFNPEKGHIEPYEYPEEAYGILSTWDVGHLITYHGQRIPVSNPFQQGLGRVEEEITVAGEATVFTETDEERAKEMLEALGVRYIITEHGMAQGKGVFSSSALWSTGSTEGYLLEDGNPTKIHDNSMIVRLHYFDGRDWQLEEQEDSYVPNLNYFRLVYESEELASYSIFQDEIGKENREIRKIKVFEFLQGATLKGSTSLEDGTEVVLSTEIKTNQNRKFTYTRTTQVKDNTFEFTLPYSTDRDKKFEDWQKNETRFEVFAQPYVLKTKNIEKEINVTEFEINNQDIIEVSF